MIENKKYFDDKFQEMEEEVIKNKELLSSRFKLLQTSIDNINNNVLPKKLD